MERSNRYVVGGFLFIVVLSVLVFFSMNRYMEGQTVSDTRRVAQNYVRGIAEEELYHYNSVVDIRLGQVRHMKEYIEKNANTADAESVARAIAEIAAYQEITTCGLVDADGAVETVYGVPFHSFGDLSFVLESMAAGRKAVTGGDNEMEQQIVWLMPAEYAMKNGKTSKGIICCRPMSVFVDKMNLDASSGLAYFHLVRRNGTYVVRGRDSGGESFPDKMLAHAKGIDQPMESIVQELQEALIDMKPYAYESEYREMENGPMERRSAYVFPLPHSNWHIVSVMPYNSMDQMIRDMGEARVGMMYLAVGVLFAAMLVLFILYYRMSDRQVHALEEAKERAEDAMVEAETASEEAMRSKQEADEARGRAEDALVEAEAANDEAMRSKQEADEARVRAEEALVEAEAANDEAMRSKADADRAREEAEIAREDAIAANKAKSEFLSNMSHDIRTPMNAIVGMTAIAQDHMDDKERVKECLRKITLSGKQLLGLINDVLDMSKIESGKMTLNLEALSLRQAMETICDIIRPQINSKNQNFDILISNIIAEDIYCDSVRLNQVMLNFLSNAMKFTPEKGSIHIGLWQEESPKGANYVRTHLSVKDTGMGMTKEFKQKLFTAFEREDNRRVHQIQGTGLGLTITKHIVDAMGGEIEVDSEPGMGTTFHIIIDFEKVAEPDKEMKLPDWKVLVVDDNEDLCRTAELSLRELGTQPEFCTDGPTAIQKVVEAHKKGEDFFAILVDYKMEGMDGIETTRKIREVLGDNIPISLISAYDWSEIETEAKAAGITGFIAKPLFKSTLFHELKKYAEGGADTAADHITEEQAADLTGMQILLAEDMDVNAEIAIMVLEEAGATVDRARDGKIATQMFEGSEEGHYDVILMDLRMPNMNGYEATQAIRSMKRADAVSIPILAMTADAFAEDAQKCMEAGMNAHIAKPIDVDALKKMLVKYMKRG